MAWFSVPMQTRIPVLLLTLLSACQSTATNSPATPKPFAITSAKASGMLDAQVALWNAGDLPGFVATYWDGPELTFLGSSGLTRGSADLLALYRQGYPTAAARGVLSFQVLELTPLGSEHALLLGKYTIKGEHPSSGFFSLVLAERNGAIVILHDHTSAAAN